MVLLPLSPIEVDLLILNFRCKKHNQIGALTCNVWWRMNTTKQTCAAAMIATKRRERRGDRKRPTE